MAPERLEFGKLPKEEAEFRRRSAAAKKAAATRAQREKRLPSDSVIPLIETTLISQYEQWEEELWKKRDAEREQYRLQGKEVEIPWSISPSIAARCLRWEGFRALREKPGKLNLEAVLALMSGTQLHWGLLRSLGQGLPSSRRELPFSLPEGISGRIDWLYLADPALLEYEVIDFKTASHYSFQQVGREGLPKVYRDNTNYWWPKPEDRKQILYYIVAARKLGFNVKGGRVIYIDLDRKKMKEAIVPWDPNAEYEAEQLLERTKKAKEKIDQKELPDPSVESAHTCGYCPYCLKCDYGQKEAGKRVRKKARQKPIFVQKKQKEHAEEVRKKMEELGVVQPTLAGFSPPEREPRRNSQIKEIKEEKQPPCCADCGQPMVLEKKAARGGRYVCSHCGNH